MTTPLLSVQNLSYTNGSDSVLENVSLVVNSGDYLGLIGPNGGGKTTLLKLALGLIAPTTGTVAWFGTPLKKFKEWYRIGYVSQKAIEFDALFPATVGEVVSMGRYAHRGLFRFTTHEDTQKAQAALEAVSMLPYLNRRISDLSGGQKQRVFIARALASEPEIIVLDEPTTGVDQKTQEQFYELVRRLNVERGLTILLVSHDLERVAKEASCIAVVDHTLTYFEHSGDAVHYTGPMGFHH